MNRLEVVYQKYLNGLLREGDNAIKLRILYFLGNGDQASDSKKI
jgi:hypothetical protein